METLIWWWGVGNPRIGRSWGSGRAGGGGDLGIRRGRGRLRRAIWENLESLGERSGELNLTVCGRATWERGRESSPKQKCYTLRSRTLEEFINYYQWAPALLVSWVY